MKKIVIFFALALLLVGLVVIVSLWPSSPKKENQINLKLNLRQSNMKILSQAFNPETEIPSKYTCDGENISPPLKLENIPQDAKELVLVVDDPDAPMGTWIHWVVFNLKPIDQEILEGKLPPQAKQGLNSFGYTRYGGPCPPSGRHRYFFKLFALDEALNLPDGSPFEKIKKFIETHTLAYAEFFAYYSRK